MSRAHKGRVNLLAFIAAHPVFRLDDLAKEFGHRSRAALSRALHNHVADGVVRNIHRGVYTRLPDHRLDPWLLASRLTPRGIVAQEGALSFYGLCKPTFRIPLVSEERLLPVRYHRHEFVSVRYTWGQDAERDRHFVRRGLSLEFRQGLMFNVFVPERAFVDCAQRLEHEGGMKWLTEVFLAATDLRAGLLWDCAGELCSAVAIARLGMLMELHPRLSRAESTLEAMERRRPATPAYFDPSLRQGRLVPRWNVIIPEWFFDLRRHLF